MTMKLQNFKETFWRSVKFFLLFTLILGLLYILLTKFMIKVPIADNKKLLTAITEFEKVIAQEKRTATDAKVIRDEIKAMEFDIYQVQKQDEIKRSIFKIEAMYVKNNRLSNYKFLLQISKILDIYYFSREKNSNLKSNMELLSKNLVECQANL